MDTVRAHVYIEGRVQGVFFRDWTLRQAQGLRLTGWVRNLGDGRVEVVLEGLKATVEVMVEKCKEGPELAKIKHTDVIWEKATKEYRNFEVVR
jgi:acylphosphatase